MYKKTDIESSGLRLIILLGLVAALAPLSIDMYLPSFPTIRSDFGATAGQVQLTLSSYMLGFTLGQLGYGPLSDRFGRRPVLIAGIVLYVTMTIICAISISPEMLVVFRGLQALGGAAGTVLSRAIIRDCFSGPYMARAMSLLLTFILFAPMIAPVFGGYILIWFGWRAIFWTLAICGCLALLIVFLGIGESLPRERRMKPGFGPVLKSYIRVLSHREALGYILSGGATFGALFAFLSGASFVYIEYYGVAPEHMGYIFAVNVIGVMAGGWLNSRLVVIRGVRKMMALGIWFLLIGALIFYGLLATDVFGLWGGILGIILFTLPLNLINANAAAGALEFFPDAAGTASSVVGAIRYGWGAISGLFVGLLHDGTPMPMLWVILVCSIASLLVFKTMVRRG